ncbi:unnamed protein product [Cylindrotheca closterium]|uniref:Fe2OG dioxygenase domain-containing protein n=1 Tax=Cylindrotheca closterium TaxID=2856 RepID=A0AAD2CYG9_9STRA|nr:unnamed protein product [Cylindrotheca closterium]
MNFEKYPWLVDLSSPEAVAAIEKAQQSFQQTGAAIFPNFLSGLALQECIQDARAQESTAFTTDDVHTAYLRPINENTDPLSVENLEMRTQVASIAYDELPPNSILGSVYEHPLLRKLVSKIVGKDTIYLSDDSLGCCSINVFRAGYHHSFHFDESEFSTTLMLQESEIPGTGLFQYTKPLRDSPDDLALTSVANAIHAYANDAVTTKSRLLLEASSAKEQTISDNNNNNDDDDDDKSNSSSFAPSLHTLDFAPGTLSIFAGSKSLHRVTRVKGKRSRLVAVFTFASQPGFQNTSTIQNMFWGRSSSRTRPRRGGQKEAEEKQQK